MPLANGSLELNGMVSFLKGGINYCDEITTVSNTYAEEIKTQQGGEGLDGLLRSKSEILKGIILTELYLDIIQNSVNEVLYLENRVTIKQFIKDDIDDEEVKFKCDLLVSFKIEDKIQSYFIKYIDKDYDIRRYMELIKKFDTFVKDEELVDRYCIISDKKPKLVFIADTQELMQDLFNTIINYNIDFNNICLSCLDVVFKDKESKRFKEEDAFLDIAAYV